jgi:hypothetical protein
MFFNWKKSSILFLYIQVFFLAKEEKIIYFYI